MDSKNAGVGKIVYGVIILIWVVVSVVIYGTICILLSFVNAKAARFVARQWTKHLLLICGIKADVEGLEKLDVNKRYIFIANHQSHLDIPVIMASLPHEISFIAKKELFMIPFFGWGIFALGHIWLDRSNPRKAISSIQKAIDRLKRKKVSLVLFPEGTRSSDGKLGTFKQGSFALVLKAGVEVVPLVIKGTFERLPKYKKIISSGRVKLIICNPIPVTEIMTKAEISEKIYNIIKTKLN
ncbi:MAG: 1-acyl-sn-glycerol-3-phosphate acyltransferase [Chitinispirillaceae bacterium]|nr:1-acyl-sn-glycerol-3-phosphate acyltransferase [Chitinispirillaceae bacterium]